mgnify:CR=1 FL=1
METQIDYRAHSAMNYSRIKDFYTLGLLKYYKRHILKEKVEEKDSAALIVGSAVDVILFEGEDMFNKLFHCGDNVKIPTGKGGDFTLALHKFIKEGMEFNLACKMAYSKAEMAENRFDGFMSKFADSDNALYLKSLQEAEGKTSISVSDKERANTNVHNLKTSPITKFLFEGDGYSQLELYFDYNGYPMKCKLDKLLVDKANKTLRPWDLKVFYDVNDFEFRYTKDKLYIQEAVYMKGIESFRDEHYPGWKIDKFKFCISHSANLWLPVLYNIKVTEGDLYEGFTTKSGRYHKGLDAMLSEISWHEDNNIWNTTYELHNNKGIANRVI